MSLSKDSTPDEVFAEWMRRLRSGNYTQTQGQLCVSFPGGKRSYCCLGVLTEMAVEADLVTESVEPVVKYWPAPGDHGAMPEESGLLRVVREWAGIGTMSAQFRHTPVVPEGAPTDELGRSDAPNSLIVANDLLGYNFSQIADLAELNREALR